MIMKYCHPPRSHTSLVPCLCAPPGEKRWTKSNFLGWWTPTLYDNELPPTWWPGDGDCYIMHRMQSDGWPYSKVGRDSSKAPSLRAAVFRSKILRSDRNHWSSHVIMHTISEMNLMSWHIVISWHKITVDQENFAVKIISQSRPTPII